MQTIKMRSKNQTELLSEIRSLTQYGRIVPYDFCGDTKLFINDARLTNWMLSNTEKRANAFTPVIEKVTGQGLLTNRDLELWKNRRLTIQRLLAPSNISQYEKRLIQRTQLVYKDWNQGQRVGMKEVVNDLTLDNLASAVIGGDFGDFRNNIKTTLALMVESMDDAVSKIVNEEKLEKLDHFVSLLESYVATISEQKSESPSEKEYIIDALLRAKKTSKKEFVDPWVRDEIITLMMAGFDTTSFLIGIAIFHVSQNQEIKDRLTAEVREAEKNPQNSFIESTPYLRMITSEALRMYPSAPFIGRFAHESKEIDGFVIEKDTDMMMSPWVTQMDEEYFPDPFVFNPERFSPDNRENIVKGSYFPFSMGPRICPGNHFAMQEAAIAIGLICAHVDFEYELEQPKIDCPVTLRFADPLFAKVVKIE
jgi:cytochrome P450